MKLAKGFFVLIILFFILSAISNIIEFAVWISGDVLWVEVAVYCIFGLAMINFLVIPLIGYRKKPTIEDLAKAIKGDNKAYRKIITHFRKSLDAENKRLMENAVAKSTEDGCLWIKTYVNDVISSFDGVIRQFAFKMTATVMLSPNSVIDGLTILFGNARMIYTLTSKIQLRYSLKDLWNIYFSIFSIASLSGLIEEFDEAIEDMAQEFLEEFSEFMEEQTGKAVGDSLPVLGLVVKSLSPIIQAAGNYAFIIYNGNRFKYRLLSGISEMELTEEEIRKKARLDARKARYKYVDVMVRKLGKKSSDGVKNKLTRLKFRRTD